jgi:hypothetical protein
LSNIHELAAHGNLIPFSLGEKPTPPLLLREKNNLKIKLIFLKGYLA